MFMVESLRNKYISQLVKTKSPVYIYLKNGVRLTGILVGHSHEALFLNGGATQIIFKHLVSTVTERCVYS